MKTESEIGKKGNDEQNQVQVIPTVSSQEVLFSRKPKKAFEEMRELVQMMSSQCTGPKFISNINGKQYPKVEWWTNLGAVLGLFPVVIYSRRLDRDDEIVYESRVEVRLGEKVVAAGEALCSNREPNWMNSPEYSIKSMSITRSTGKAYRIPLSFIAVMAGLAPTPAEEMFSVDSSDANVQAGSVATTRQIEYIKQLCNQMHGRDSKRRMMLHLAAKYNVASLEELTKEEASELINFLQANVQLFGEEIE